MGYILGFFGAESSKYFCQALDIIVTTSFFLQRALIISFGFVRSRSLLFTDSGSFKILEKASARLRTPSSRLRIPARVLTNFTGIVLNFRIPVEAMAKYSWLRLEIERNHRYTTVDLTLSPLKGVWGACIRRPHIHVLLGY